MTVAKPSRLDFSPISCRGAHPLHAAIGTHVPRNFDLFTGGAFIAARAAHHGPPFAVFGSPLSRLCRTVARSTSPLLTPTHDLGYAFHFFATAFADRCPARLFYVPRSGSRGIFCSSRPPSCS